MCNKVKESIAKGVIIAECLIKSVILCNRWLAGITKDMLEQDDI